MRETYSKIKYCNYPYSSDEIRNINDRRLKATFRTKDNIIHDKKAEIYQLREEIENLKALIEWLMGQMHTKSK